MPIDPTKIQKAREVFEQNRKGTLWTPRNKILALLALLYLISPIDLVPDWIIPFVGWLDDLGVISLVALWIVKHRAPALPEEGSEPPDPSHQA